jgi:vacuolar-type H+-ATPase subunit I/STV1
VQDLVERVEGVVRDNVKTSKRRKAKFSKLVETLVAKHKEVDEGKETLPAEVRAKEENAIKALEEKIATLDEWLNTEKDKIGHTGQPTEKPPLR